MLNYILFILYTLSEPNGNWVIKYLCNLLLSVRLSCSLLWYPTPSTAVSGIRIVGT